MNNRFASNPFAQGPPTPSNPAAGEYVAGRDFFRAKVTAKSSVGGVWQYTWSEQTFDPITGAFADANPGRSGAPSDSPALEFNNAELNLTSPVYVRMQQKGFVGGQPYYEFTAPGGTTSASTDCTGCGWLAGLKQTECLEVLVNGVTQYVYLKSSDRLTWTSSNTVTICGTAYTATVTTNAGGVPQLTLAGVGSGAPSYAGVFNCCVCKSVTWNFPLDVLCPSATDPHNPCLNVVAVTARWIDCCPIAGWKGPGWYCTRAAGSSDACAPVELLDADKCDGTIEICSGPYADEAEATSFCAGDPPPIDPPACVSHTFVHPTATISEKTGTCTCVVPTTLTGSGGGIDACEFTMDTGCPAFTCGPTHHIYTLACSGGVYVIGGPIGFSSQFLYFTASPWTMVIKVTFSGGSFLITITDPP